MKSKAFVNLCFGVGLGLALLPNLSHAVQESHGGVAIVCPPGSEFPTMLLDIWEATRELNLTLTSKPSSVKEQMVEVIRRLTPYPRTQRDFIWNHQRIFAKRSYIDPRMKMPLTGDFSGRVLPKECNYGQLGTYRGGWHLDIDGTIEALMDNTGITGFETHEVVYKMDRDRNGAKTSDNSRELVAYLLADQENSDQIARYMGSAEKLTSKTGENQIWIDPFSKEPIALKITMTATPIKHRAPWVEDRKLARPKSAWYRVILYKKTTPQVLKLGDPAHIVAPSKETYAKVLYEGPFNNPATISIPLSTEELKYSYLVVHFAGATEDDGYFQAELAQGGQVPENSPISFEMWRSLGLKAIVQTYEIR